MVIGDDWTVAGRGASLFDNGVPARRGPYDSSDEEGYCNFNWVAVSIKCNATGVLSWRSLLQLEYINKISVLAHATHATNNATLKTPTTSFSLPPSSSSSFRTRWPKTLPSSTSLKRLLQFNQSTPLDSYTGQFLRLWILSQLSLSSALK